MARNKLSLLFFVIIGFAIVGLFTQLFTNPGGFFKNILIMVGIGVVIAAIIYFVMTRSKTSTNDMKKYKKAVRQSKAKYKADKPVSFKSATNKKQASPIKKKRTKRSTNHLRVIEGNKTKRKDRASF
ncbi:hypothetical protein D8M04_02165 [Oceanobacillus piezotolerans]|uniref:Uncharacterized protein n=1 Tax=Oceanobacillus piezotolerans TaxID=2448030 RepID=A0A498DD02_9BACI|nr:SA1362 family protein [Oceanobacillus piezotolerans]RLL48102.1 hypothetical protein D8M04_02165 [Oceanobacillus piezotolerans]